MIKTHIHSYGKIADTHPMLLPVVVGAFWASIVIFCISLTGLLPHYMKVGSLGVTIALVMVATWRKNITTNKAMALKRRMEKFPDRFVKIPDMSKHSLYGLLRAHDDKTGSVHIIIPPESDTVTGYAEFETETDRVLFRLSL